MVRGRGGFRRRAAASFNPEIDKLHLPSNAYLGTAIGRSVVVHQCTHAQIDYRATNSSIRSEESAAFLASGAVRRPLPLPNMPGVAR